MILESKQEEDAFNFICELASAYTDRICNDLNPDMVDKFKGLKVEREEQNGEKFLDDIAADYDVIYWLQCRNKHSHTKD